MAERAVVRLALPVLRVRPTDAPPELTQLEQVMLELYPRPTLRADCLPGGSNAERPCPYLGCRYHLGLEATDVGSLKLVTGWDDGGPSCALDVADEGPATLEQVGDLLGLTRERTRQVEVLALHRAREGALRLGGRHDDE